MMAPARGIALITALLVVAIATLAATALLGSTSVAIHRTAALRDSEQAWWVARGVESWVLGILDKDRKDSPNVDGLGEDWAQPVDYLPVDQGFVRGKVFDLQGCFNLNNLLDKTAANAEYRAQLARLLAAFPPELDVPPGLTGAIIDWADADQSPTLPSGAEDIAYLSLDPPYRTADRPFTVVSELLAVHGVTPQLYGEFGREDGPCLAALPATVSTKINVNTAPAAVLRALSKTVDEGKLQDFLGRRQDEPAQNAQELVTSGALGGDATAYITSASEYFQIRGEVFVGSSRVALYSLIHRPGTGAPTVIAHSADAE
jgi:general secretion pathway protein K